jgi:hypothetical protein
MEKLKMRSRYDGVRGKEQMSQKSRQTRLEAEHNSNDAFVKKQQAALSKLAGKTPKLPAEAQKFNAYMCNTGAHAQEIARGLSKGMDKTAFPVK